MLSDHLPPSRSLPIRAAMTKAMAALCLLATVTACGAEKKDGRENVAPQVGFMLVRPQAVPLVSELPARVNAFRIAEVRPQVNGIIERRLFSEGSYVKAGQPLYRIDASLYRAAVGEAAASLASARASAEAAKARADRYRPLAADEAVSQQDYTDAAAQARQAAASVAQGEAALSRARTNLRYTTVPAPISGRIGRSFFTQGALVTGNQAEPLAVISVLDPIYVDIQQSASELLALRRLIARNGGGGTQANVRLLLDDGSEYAYDGTVEFSEVTVDPQAGTVTLRARFPNPENLLLPGMFVRTRFAQAQYPDAVLVPQPALSRDEKGGAHVFVVGAGNKAERREVTAARTSGGSWIVTSGLKAGDKLITSGIFKLRDGQSVRPEQQGKSSKAVAPAKPGVGTGKAD